MLSPRSPALLSSLTWCGAAYLVWLGGKLLNSKGVQAEQALSTNHPAAFRAGLASGLLNPKNILFYFSLFSLGAEHSSPLTRTGYGLWMFTVVFLWDAWLARSLGHGRLHAWLRARQRRIERGCGALFLLLAGALATGGHAFG